MVGHDGGPSLWANIVGHDGGSSWWANMVGQHTGAMMAGHHGEPTWWAITYIMVGNDDVRVIMHCGPLNCAIMTGPHTVK